MGLREKGGRRDLRDAVSRQISPTDPTPLDADEVRSHCYCGFSDALLRPRYWKVFLEYYSKNKFRTEMFLRSRRRSYALYASEAENACGREKWYKVIENDVSRTFLKPRSEHRGPGGARYCEFLDTMSVNPGETHRHVVERILKCYAVTNSSVGYVQGMALVLAVVYYVLDGSKDEEDRRHCEEDSFFCFHSLMVEIGDNFMEDLDHGGGIAYKMSRVMEIVKEADGKLYKAMESKGLVQGGFHMKWILLMFVSCFGIEDVLWLWDRLLSDRRRFEMVLYCCASMIVMMRSTILQEGFDACMELLQEPPVVDVKTMFNVAECLRRRLPGAGLTDSLVAELRREDAQAFSETSEEHKYEEANKGGCPRPRSVSRR